MYESKSTFLAGLFFLLLAIIGFRIASPETNGTQFGQTADFIGLGLIILISVASYRRGRGKIPIWILLTVLGPIFVFQGLSGNLENQTTSITGAKFFVTILIVLLFSDRILFLKDFRNLTVTFFGLVYLANVIGVLRVGALSGLDFQQLDNRHTNAYIASSIFLVVIYTPMRRTLKLITFALSLAFLAYLQVMTAFITVAVVIVSLFLMRGSRSLVWAFLTVPVFGIGAVAYRESQATSSSINLSNSGIGSVGSGRVSAWSDQISEYLNSTLYQQIFGTGPGSSTQFWGLWWWQAKDPHSDFLRVLIEYGAIGFIALAAFVIFVIRKGLSTNNFGLVAFALGAITSSAVSNGIFARPYAAICWSVAAFVVGWQSNKERQSDEIQDFERDPLIYRSKNSLPIQ